MPHWAWGQAALRCLWVAGAAAGWREETGGIVCEMTLARRSATRMQGDQQRQALEYFRSFAGEWRGRAEGRFPTEVNVSKLRNDYALLVAGELTTLERALDVGCGTGELVCNLARLGAHAVGVDFAPEMIDMCEARKRKEGTENAAFVCASILDYKPGDSFDLIVANGFIEYISPAELERFLQFIRDNLMPGGSFVVGSRNRLFNAFSLNGYTKLEQQMDTIDALIDQSLSICTAGTMAECIHALMNRRQSLPLMSQHPRTGIEVSTRHQYTPAELVGLVQRFGLTTVELYPVHCHGVVPRFKDEHPEVHLAIANLVQDFARGRHWLIPWSSTFAVHAVLE